MFNFKNKIVVLTGGARGIGKCIREKFKDAGATVCVIDLLENDYFVGDPADKKTLESFAKKVIADYGHVDYLIHNAAPKMCGIENGSYEKSAKMYGFCTAWSREAALGASLPPTATTTCAPST